MHPSIKQEILVLMKNNILGVFRKKLFPPNMGGGHNSKLALIPEHIENIFSSPAHHQAQASHIF